MSASARSSSAASGNGEAITANRIPGVRCALCWNVESAELARRHNDANVISIGQRMISEDVALAIVRTWLDVPFDGGRHARRIGQIDGVQIGGVPIEGARRPRRRTSTARSATHSTSSGVATTRR